MYLSVNDHERCKSVFWCKFYLCIFVLLLHIQGERNLYLLGYSVIILMQIFNDGVICHLLNFWIFFSVISSGKFTVLLHGIYSLLIKCWGKCNHWPIIIDTFRGSPCSSPHWVISVKCLSWVHPAFPAMNIIKDLELTWTFIRFD